MKNPYIHCAVCGAAKPCKCDLQKEVEELVAAIRQQSALVDLAKGECEELRGELAAVKDAGRALVAYLDRGDWRGNQYTDLASAVRKLTGQNGGEE
jgi:hypothetical protein